MSRKENAVLQFLIWCAVYPSVLVFSYGLEWLAPDLPKWLSILISTSMSVPFIGLVAAPYMQKIMASAQDRTRAELLADQMREADGPDPEDL